MFRTRRSPRGRELFSAEEIEKQLERVNSDSLIENHIILITVLNPIQKINVDVIHKICQGSGDVEKIVIFERDPVVHALVQFKDKKSAKDAKNSLHGCNIYSDCCTLKVEFARQDELNVKRNDESTWDFTNTEEVTKTSDQPKPRKVLLSDIPPSKEIWGQERTLKIGSLNEEDIQRSRVMMVYNMDPEKFNCQRLFNMLCLYGNIVRINFIRNRKGCAMVEFERKEAAEDAAYHLNGIEIFGCRLSFDESRKPYVEEIRNPYDLPDGEKSFENFIGDRNNRFSTPKQAAKNRKSPPSKILHFYNVPKMEDDSLMDVFSDLDAPFPTSVTWFESKSEKSATGLVEFDSIEDACEALVIANNTEVENEDIESSRPYIMKLCFARSY